MKLHEIFKQPVDRPLKGVIIADDNDTLEQEVKEYVVTKEVESRLSKFLDAYNNYEGANGVWISGFFGSGKSHLLKMVASGTNMLFPYSTSLFYTSSFKIEVPIVPSGICTPKFSAIVAPMIAKVS